MTAHFHAVVWIDHREARIFPFSAEAADKLVIAASGTHPHLHHKANVIGDGRAAPDTEYLDQIARALTNAGEILICGPANAKLELKKHIATHWPQIDKKIVGLETVDHPTDGALMTYARRYFIAADRMRPQLG